MQLLEKTVSGRLSLLIESIGALADTRTACGYLGVGAQRLPLGRVGRGGRHLVTTSWGSARFPLAGDVGRWHPFLDHHGAR